MYGTTALTPKALEDYRPLAGDAAIDEIRRLAAPLEGLRVLHLSATAFGTGVAELLNAAVPLLSNIGLDCHWQVVRPAEESAAASKALYRALAGSGSDWSPEHGEVWLRYSAMNAEQLTEPFDVIVMHDPQPAAIRSFAPEAARSRARWVFHSHLDLSSARPDAWALLRQHLEPYDAIAFDADAFVHPDLRTVPLSIIPPAIDPLGPRNMELAADVVEQVLSRYGIDSTRPLLYQMAPCEPGSDFLGAIDVHDRVRREVPGLQLVLVAMHPPEDPDSITYLDECVRKSMEYSDVYILRGVSEVGNVESNAFQRAADVVIQKGLRKGFGLWIADAMWKGRPVVTARTGGLAQQVLDGETGFLADTTDAFAERVSQLLRDPALAEGLGRAGHRHVAEHFLLTRFIADELRLLAGLTRSAA
jgi:trehalose synthase